MVFPQSCLAEGLAFADLSTDSAWLFTIDQVRELAQQHSAKDVQQLYWYVNEPAPPGARVQSEMEQYRIDSVAHKLGQGAGVLAD